MLKYTLEKLLSVLDNLAYILIGLAMNAVLENNMELAIKLNVLGLSCLFISYVFGLFLVEIEKEENFSKQKK